MKRWFNPSIEKKSTKSRRDFESNGMFKIKAYE